MSTANPFNALLSLSPESLISSYQTHRTSRNSTQRTLHLAPDFHPTRDTILHSLITSGTPDPRNCLVLWSRPPNHIITLITEIQSRLSQLIHGNDFQSIKTSWSNDSNTVPSPVELTGGSGKGGVWWMPPSHLHMTILEAVHSATRPEIEAAIERLPNGVDDLQHIADIATEKRNQGVGKVVLTSPRIGFDGAALAVGFVPKCNVANQGGNGNVNDGKWYSYHHLRRDVWDAADKAGLRVESRYVVPSAHATIMRYVDEDVEFMGGVEGWVKGIEEINKWLEDEWDGAEWVVAEEKGLVWQKGRLWYGGGEMVVEGRKAE